MPRIRLDDWSTDDGDRRDRRGRGADQPAYRKPAYRPLHTAAEALFRSGAPTAAPQQSWSTRPPGAPADDPVASPPIKARVKFFSGDKGFGILRSPDAMKREFFLSRRVLPDGIGEEQLPPETELLVRVEPDRGGKNDTVTEVLEIKAPALRTERGTVVRWHGHYGFVSLDCNGQFIYVAYRLAEEAGLEPDESLIGTAVEIDATLDFKPRAVRVRKVV